ncbi:hypothetical protein ASPSYDRAFT_47476 [Aspergillus sydowii CBS 593.65]|uniref:Secreted RxLR effector peptide protein n=1 Tax=Aspergillus sydowii CBS 593.65 TaxID=1036612 RepID=A0A1L9TCL6_9EURO|nr:uncharacterized protein ASPSYDRAFT_47476 [Aspergillus sydowii CBS 593.65]OJJ57178.1 hypothetical protein ASPSYDRAFT_47476 [Aspergillus sydowii CBS 593.65]
MTRSSMPRLTFTIAVLCLLLHSVTAYPTAELARVVRNSEVARLSLLGRGNIHASSIDLSERPDADPLEQRDNQMP